MERDNLLEKEILSLLSPELPLSLLCFDELPSTNTFLKELGRAGTPANTVCLARCQSAGRGRLGRRFESRAGQGLYLSMLLRPRVSPEAMLPATGLAAVAAMAAVEKASGLICGINGPTIWSAGRKNSAAFWLSWAFLPKACWIMSL